MVHINRHGQLVILHRPCCAASSQASRNCHRQQDPKVFKARRAQSIPFAILCTSPVNSTKVDVHFCSPVLCSRGLLARSKVYGLVLMVSVNCLRFSLTCRKFSSISSIFSEFTSNV